MKVKGFISSLFLFYLLFITSYITVQIDSILKLSQSIEMLDILSESIVPLNESIAYLRCATYNHEVYIAYSKQGYTLVAENDFERNKGIGKILLDYPITIAYEFDIESLSLHITDISQ